MSITVGTCGNCGGRVSVPTAWGSVVPPVPACDRCHAKVARPHGPVIEMERNIPTPPHVKEFFDRMKTKTAGAA